MGSDGMDEAARASIVHRALELYLRGRRKIGTARLKQNNVERVPVAAHGRWRWSCRFARGNEQPQLDRGNRTTQRGSRLELRDRLLVELQTQARLLRQHEHAVLQRRRLL